MKKYIKENWDIPGMIQRGIKWVRCAYVREDAVIENVNHFYRYQG
jgi:hypothetical protein